MALGELSAGDGCQEGQAVAEESLHDTWRPCHALSLTCPRRVIILTPPRGVFLLSLFGGDTRRWVAAGLLTPRLPAQRP